MTTALRLGAERQKRGKAKGRKQRERRRDIFSAGKGNVLVTVVISEIQQTSSEGIWANVLQLYELITAAQHPLICTRPHNTHTHTHTDRNVFVPRCEWISDHITHQNQLNSHGWYHSRYKNYCISSLLWLWRSFAKCERERKKKKNHHYCNKTDIMRASAASNLSLVSPPTLWNFDAQL